MMKFPGLGARLGARIVQIRKSMQAAAVSSVAAEEHLVDKQTICTLIVPGGKKSPSQITSLLCNRIRSSKRNMHMGKPWLVWSASVHSFPVTKLAPRNSCDRRNRAGCPHLQASRNPSTSVKARAKGPIHFSEAKHEQRPNSKQSLPR